MSDTSNYSPNILEFTPREKKTESKLGASVLGEGGVAGGLLA